MVRNNQSWNLGDPEVDDHGQPVINDVIQKLGCIRHKDNIDLSVHSKSPGDVALTVELLGQPGDQQNGDMTQKNPMKDINSLVLNQTGQESSQKHDNSDFELDYWNFAMGTMDTMALLPYTIYNPPFDSPTLSRKMPKSRLKWEYTEDDMAEAILDITDHGFSPPQAAQRRGVPRTTLIDRLNGRGAAEDQIQPRRRLSKSQEDRLAFWILRQESLGYAPSHSQIRACVMGLLRQQGEHPDLGRNWVIKFINRRADLKTKMGRRQEAKRFNSFTPRAVHWYFDIRDGQYGWIKPENTVNVDEGGLDSLVVGSADPKRKAFLKGPQTRNWTSFIEAVTADGRALVPGIIFKGKELQKQWFLDEFKQIADWYYITSPNGWTDDHIGIEWLERVYLPQTTPADESDARLIILDGHGSHATPLDNGVFNALKAAYRRELERFASLTDSAPMDKVNFIRAYAKARRVGMTKKNILSGWRVTGNWPISRSKALRHPEIQQDRPNSGPRVTPEPRPYLGSDDTPQTSRQIRDLGLNKTPKTRRRYNVIAKGFEAQQQTVAAHTQRIASLEEELARLKRGKKRKAVPNPNRRFMTLGETLAVGEAIPEGETQNESVVVESVCSDERESESEASSVIEVREEAVPQQRTTRSGRLIKRPKF
ncbi:hypothetical protein ACKAV7_008367 [Fusarium commune]